MIIPFREGKLSPNVKDGICQGPAQQPRGFLHGSRSQESPTDGFQEPCEETLSSSNQSAFPEHLLCAGHYPILGRQSHDQQTP